VGATWAFVSLSFFLRSKNLPRGDSWSSGLGLGRQQRHMLPIGGLDQAVCNDFGNRIPYDDYLRAFSEIRVPLRWPKAAPNLEPRDDIWPTEPAPRQSSDVVRMVLS
jgi:hypothetical protein